MKHSLSKMSNDNNSKFYIVFTFVILTVIFSIPSLVIPFPSALATSSNNNEGNESGTDQSSNEVGVAISNSDENHQQLESTTNNDEANISESDETPSMNLRL
ncbi:MAG: hypothetical protein P0116_11625 [Candidatus Nitrosocosmicus sp.]|nr:hypothetical protein [Candidatus Nitrosocosmicus sp.]